MLFTLLIRCSSRGRCSDSVFWPPCFCCCFSSSHIVSACIFSACLVLCFSVICKSLLPYVCPLCYALQMSRSASTFSLNDSAKSSAVVQRSNSLDHPPVRARVPVCMRTPCSPTPIPANSPGPKPAPESSRSLCPNYSARERKSLLHGPIPTQPAQPQSSLNTSVQGTSATHPNSIPAVRNSRISQPRSSQHVSRHLPHVGSQQKSLALQAVNVKGRTFSESCRDRQVPLDPRKAVLTSPRRETLL